MLPTPRRTLIPILLALPILTGCSSGSPDDEYRALVQDLHQRQAAQQESLLRQSEQLTDASRQLIEADAAARRELTEMQSRLQQEFASERQSIDGQREKLDDERREIAAQRHRDPLIATALLQTGTLLVAALPLVLLLLLIRASRNEPTEVPLAELLVHEFSADEPALLPGPVVPAARLEHAPSKSDARDAGTDDRPDGQPDEEHSDEKHNEPD